MWPQGQQLDTGSVRHGISVTYVNTHISLLIAINIVIKIFLHIDKIDNNLSKGLYFLAQYSF